MYFNESIKRGDRSISLKTGLGSVIATYDAANSNNLSISGSALTSNPTADLSYFIGYKVEFAAGSIKDLAGNNFAGTSNYNFNTKDRDKEFKTSVFWNKGNSPLLQGSHKWKRYHPVLRQIPAVIMFVE